MGVAERKEREKLELRQRIIDAARQMFVEEGFEKTSIRKIAEAIEYSPGTIYLYFKNKDELFYAIHAELFVLLSQRLVKAFEVSHPVEQLRRLGEEYLHFALENPEYYDLMFVMRAPMQVDETEEEWTCVEHAFGVLHQVMKACIEGGHFPHKDLTTAVMTVWSHMHGMVTLYIRDRLKMFPEASQMPLIRRSADMVIEMMQKP